MYKEGARYVVTTEFSYDNRDFIQGEEFTVVGDQSFGNFVACYFERFINGHSLLGTVPFGYGWNIPRHILTPNTKEIFKKPDWEV